MIGTQMGLPLDHISGGKIPSAVNQVKIPYEIQQACAEIDQHVKVSVDLTSSLKEVMNSDQPMLEHLSKGFKVTLDLSLISNVKEAILEKLKDEDSQDMVNIFRALGPAFMLALKGNMNFTFDDFEDLRENPMMAAFMPSFSDLFEGMLGKGPNEVIDMINTTNP